MRSSLPALLLRPALQFGFDNLYTGHNLPGVLWLFLAERRKCVRQHVAFGP
ncbi:hypothetical protein X949_4042 [Burkholderia pseudomallei MSHR5609]|nr:hypothetical protein X949_4042 [Burkholderia pseudomallei MSHR5609]